MDPTLPLAIGGLAASVWAFLHTRKRAPRSVAFASAVVALAGAECALLGVGHVYGVIERAATRTDFVYDFRFYSLVLLGFVLAAAGLAALCVIPGLANRSIAAWRAAFWSSAFLAAINLSLGPIQGFGYVLGGLSVASVVALLAIRRSLPPAG